jgi:hypothetical protein
MVWAALRCPPVERARATGNTALMVEHEFFGRDKRSAEFQDCHGRGGREIRGLTVEEHINRLGQDVIPLAER